MIGKDGMTTNSKPPISQIAEESIWIAETTKCKKRAGADILGAEDGSLTAEAAETKQPRCRRKNWILFELPDRLERPRCRFSSCKNNQIRAAHGCQRIPEPADRQPSLSCERPGRIHQKNVEVASELEMLKPIIQEKNIDVLLRFEPMPLCEAVPADTKRHAIPQARFH